MIKDSLWTLSCISTRD